MISLKNISLRRGVKLLFDQVNLSFHAGQKIGLIGQNGSGKTSLFSLLRGQLQPCAGDVYVSPKLRLAYVEQEMTEVDRKAIDYVIDADIELREIEKELEKAQAKNDGHKIGILYEKFENVDGYKATSKAACLLDGLGFSNTDMQKKVNELSGGWRVRLNLARALMQRSDILLLDEPTNHLDLDAVIWLENWLQNYRGTILVISHDREFLDNVVDHIANLENITIQLYRGNYSQFEKSYAEQLMQQQKHYAKQERERQHMQSFIDRFRAKATKARQAQSRIKALEKLPHLAPVYERLPFTFNFFAPLKCPISLAHLDKVTFAYRENNPILENINFSVEAADRIGLLGRNGVGKSTLIKLLAGELQPKSGVITAHQDLKIGYFAQYALDQLQLDLSPLENLKAIDQGATLESSLRSFLGSFAFSGEMALQPIHNLSGGEKARLCLAMLVWQKPNLLLLDEPTNHLDMSMREALLLALQDYQGAVILVSHDRYLLNSAVDELFLIHDKKVIPYNGDLKDYQSWLLKNRPQEDDGAGKKSERAEKNNISKVNSKHTHSDSKKINAIEKNLQKLERELAEIDQQLAQNDMYAKSNLHNLNELINKRTDLEKKIKILEEEWMQAVD